MEEASEGHAMCTDYAVPIFNSVTSRQAAWTRLLRVYV